MAGMAAILLGHSSVAGFIAVASSEKSSSSIEEDRSTAALPCGPASLAVVFQVFDVRFRNVQLAALADEDGYSSFADLRTFARDHGLFAEGVSLTPSDLLDLGRIVILHLELPNEHSGDSGPDRVPHYVVYLGQGPEQRLAVVDASGATTLNGYVDTDEIFEYWTGRALLVSDSPLPFRVNPTAWLIHWGLLAAWWVGAPLLTVVLVFALYGGLKWRKGNRLSAQQH